MEITFLSANTSKIHLHVENLMNAVRKPQTSQKARNYPHNWVGQNKKGVTRRTREIHSRDSETRDSMG